MSITVSDCLKLPSLRYGRVIAGKKGLTNIVNNASVLEIVDMDLSLREYDEVYKNGDLLITSFSAVKDDCKKQCQFLEYIREIGNAAVVIYYVGRVLKKIDQSLIDTADRIGLPLIIMPENRTDFYYSEVLGEVYELLHKDRESNNDFIENITSMISQIPENRRNLFTLLRLISNTLKCTISLCDTAMNNVCISKYPASNEIDEETICSLYSNSSTKDEYVVETEFKGVGMRIFQVPFTTFAYQSFLLYVADEFKTLTMEDMYRIIELLQFFTKLWNLNSRTILSNALIPSIIEGDEKKMRQLSQKLGININKINTAIMIHPGSDANSAGAAVRREMLKAIKEWAAETGREVIADTYNTYVICFAFLQADCPDELIGELISGLDAIDRNCTISVFSSDNNIFDVKQTYLLYNDYIDTAMVIFPQKKLFSYGTLLFAKKCEDILKEKNEEYRICRNILKPLFSCPDRKDLLKTLTTYYLDADCEMKKTSELLYLHRNSTQYRMNKIRSITNYRTYDSFCSQLLCTAAACFRLYCARK